MPRVGHGLQRGLPSPPPPPPPPPTCRIAKGAPAAILPLISHTFFHYSRHLAKFLADKGYNAAAKNDVRMIEVRPAPPCSAATPGSPTHARVWQGVFKVLRQEFQYQPTLKVSQFFGTGFVECKIIFVCDIIRHCRAKHAALWKAHKDSRARVALGKYQPNARLQGRNQADTCEPMPPPAAARRRACARVLMLRVLRSRSGSPSGGGGHPRDQERSPRKRSGGKPGGASRDPAAAAAAAGLTT